MLGWKPNFLPKSEDNPKVATTRKVFQHIIATEKSPKQPALKKVQAPESSKPAKEHKTPFLDITGIKFLNGVFVQ